jgi:hypothetical protein
LTTRQQIKKLFAPLLERNSDLVLVGRNLLIKPIRHFARSITIDRTSSADLFQPQTASTDLFRGVKWFPLGTGNRLFRDPKGPTRLWLWSDPSMPEEFDRVIECDVLPELRAIQTLDDYYRYVKSIHREHFPFAWDLRIVFCIALGRLDEAREIMTDERAARTILPYNHHSAGLGDRLKELGSGVSGGDRALLAEALHKWEAYSVEKLKLTEIWERTPFPLELETG